MTDVSAQAPQGIGVGRLSLRSSPRHAPIRDVSRSHVLVPRRARCGQIYTGNEVRIFAYRLANTSRLNYITGRTPPTRLHHRSESLQDGAQGIRHERCPRKGGHSRGQGWLIRSDFNRTDHRCHGRGTVHRLRDLHVPHPHRHSQRARRRLGSLAAEGRYGWRLAARLHPMLPRMSRRSKRSQLPLFSSLPRRCSRLHRSRSAHFVASQIDLLRG